MWRMAVLLMIPLLFACQRRAFPVEVRLLWQRDYLVIAPVDVDGDSTDEFVTITDDYVLNRISSDMRAAGKTVWAERGTFTPLTNAGESREAGIWYTHIRHDSVFLFSSRAGRSLLVTCGRDSLSPAGWDGGAEGVALLDINADGRLDAIVKVGSGYDARPRGIYALDYTTGDTLWSYLTGPNLMPVVSADVDRDGEVEILFGSLAQRNGGVANGTADDSTYVFLLDCHGRPRWVRQIGRFSSMAHAVFAPASRGLPDRVVVYETGSEEDGRSGDSAFILDWRTGEILIRRHYGRYTSCGTTVRGVEGRTRTMLGGSDDTLRVLDDSLRLVRSAWFDGGIREVIAGSFSDRGQDELVVLTQDGTMILLDTLLETRAVWSCSTSAVSTAFRLVRHGGKDRLLMASSDGSGRTWQLYGFRKVPVLRRGVPVASALGGLGLLLTAFAAVLFLLRRRQTRDIRTVIRGLTGQSGVVELDPWGDVKHTNPKARELMGGEALPAGPLAQAVKAALSETPGAAPKELPVALEGGKTVLARAARVRSGVLLTLEDISAVEYLQRVKAWAPVAQKLAHGIKNPLGTIMGAVEQIESEISKGRQGERDRGIKGSSAESGEARGEKREGRSYSSPQPSPRRGEGERREGEEAGDRVRKYVGYVKDEVARLKKMTDAFMRFTKLDPPALEPKNVNEIVRKVVAKYEGALAKGVLLDMNLDDKLPAVALDEDGMANVLDIVIENAIEAMDGRSQKLEARSEKLEVTDAGKALRIRTAIQNSTTKTPRHEAPNRTSTDCTDSTDSPAGTPGPLDPRTLVSIEVEDTGKGIPQKYLEKVFEPYFTYGKADGTGLGLALAKKIVEDHKGRMEIRSREGEGTTVAIMLPAKEGTR